MSLGKQRRQRLRPWSEFARAAALVFGVTASAWVWAQAGGGFTPAPSNLGLTQPTIPGFGSPGFFMGGLSCAGTDLTKAFQSSENELPDGCDDVEDDVEDRIKTAQPDGWDTVGKSVGAISSLGGGGAGTPPVPKCPAAPSGFKAEGVTCDAFSAGGKFAFGKFRSKKINACTAIAAHSCREKQITGLNDQVKCIKDEQAALDKQLKSISQTFNQNMSRFSSDLADMQSMQKKADQILKGNQNNGSEGLLAIQNEANGRLRQWDEEIRTVQQGYENVAFQEKWLSAMVRKSRDARVKECMTKSVRDSGVSNPNSKCGRFSGVVGTVDYLACRLGEEKRKDANGNVIQLRREERRNEATKGVGGSVDAEALMRGVMASFPEDSTIPEPPTPGANGAIASSGNIFYTSRFTSPTDIDLKFGRKLEFFYFTLPDGRKVSLRRVFMQAVEACYKEADGQIAADGGKFDSKGQLVFNAQSNQRSFGRINVIQNGIYNLEQGNKVKINQLEFDYKTLLNRTRTALTGTSLPMPSSDACQASDRAKQLQCLIDKRNEMREFFEGNTPRVAMKIALPGAKNTSGAVVNCQGLAGCITKLQRATETLEAWQSDYKREAFNSTQKFMDSMKQAYGPLCAQASNRVNFINAALGSVGQSDRRSRIRFETADKADGKIERDEQGLPKPPEDFGAAICGGGSSPYLKVDQNALAEVTGEINDNAAEAREKKSEAAAALADMDGKDKECFDQEIENLADKRLKSQIEALQTNGCGSIESLCNSAKKGSLVDLTGYASSVVGNEQLDAADLSALSGLEGICNESDSLKEEIKKLEGEIADKRAELTGQPSTREPASDTRTDEAKARDADTERKLADKERELRDVTSRLTTKTAEKDAAVDEKKLDENVSRPDIPPKELNQARITKATDERRSLSVIANLLDCTNASASSSHISQNTPALIAAGVTVSTDCAATKNSILSVSAQKTNDIKQWEAIEVQRQTFEDRRKALAERRGEVTRLTREEAELKRQKEDLEKEIGLLSLSLGRRPKGEKLDPNGSRAVQVADSIAKKEDEISKKKKQLQSGGTGEQRGGSLARCTSLVGDVKKTLDTMNRRATDAANAGFAR